MNIAGHKLLAASFHLPLMTIQLHLHVVSNKYWYRKVWEQGTRSPTRSLRSFERISLHNSDISSATHKYYELQSTN